MIPEEFDARAAIRELNALGMRDFKIEIACNYSIGYVHRVKSGAIKEMRYSAAAKLYNLLLVSRGIAVNQKIVMDNHATA